MNRRDFVKRIMTGAAAAIAAGTFDLEKALWIPGEKTFFLLEPTKIEIPRLVIGPDAAKLIRDIENLDIGGGWRWSSRGTAPMIQHERALRTQDFAAAEAIALKHGIKPGKYMPVRFGEDEPVRLVINPHDPTTFTDTKGHTS